MAARSILKFGYFSPPFRRIAGEFSATSGAKISSNVTRRLYASTAKICERKRKRKVSQKPSRMELHPKVIINDFYQAVINQFNNAELQPDASIVSCEAEPGVNGWKTTLRLKWPRLFTTEGLGRRKNESELIAYNKAILWLKKLKVLSPENEPQIIELDEIKTFLNAQRAPLVIKLENAIENRVLNLLNRYEEIKDDLLRISTARRNDADEQYVVNPITGHKLLAMNDDQIIERNFELHRKWKKLQRPDSAQLLKIRNVQQNLPIFEHRQQILDLIRDNQVVVLSGETGSGKSTQVPQYILNWFCQNIKGSNCNVIVTQPRRISAISLARRVAKERHEQLGDTVGYQVRLSSVLPNKSGAVLFCSAGILLRRMRSNPNLEGISHVILDEAHERDVLTDFLLVLLRDLIRRGSSVKFILMSASMNEEILSKYFNGCPIIRVPGITYPVKDYYLEDLPKLFGENFTQEESSSYDDPADLNVVLVARVVAAIHSTRPPGAILCFLPGVQDIRVVHEELLRILPDKSDCSICPLHSRIAQEDQSRIFDRTPSEVRKIILATNVAETSITIDDVVYVVDCGKFKETVFDPDWGSTSLRTRWITRANATQRRGRAGRVSPGECYHLFPEELLSELDAFPSPEIRRVSLEKVVLDAKVYAGESESALEFLSRCPEPPPAETVQSAIKELTKRRFLNTDESLSLLGRCAAKFSSHPYISKALIYSSWLKCLRPVLSVSAFLTGGKDVFVKTMGNKLVIRDLKQKFADGSRSDHISVVNLFDAWEETEANGGYLDKKDFRQANLLHRKNVDFVQGLRTIFTGHLTEVGLLKSTDDFEEHNVNASHRPTIIAALCAGFEPNFVRCTRGEVKKRKKIDGSAIVYRENGGRVIISSESVNYKNEPQNANIPRWLAYFLKTSCADSGLRRIIDSSPVPPLALLLFSATRINVREMTPKESYFNGLNAGDSMILSVDESKLNTFSCSNKHASLLLRLRSVIESFFSAHLLRREGISLADPVEFGNVENELREILKRLFEVEAYE